MRTILFVGGGAVCGALAYHFLKEKTDSVCCKIVANGIATKAKGLFS